MGTIERFEDIEAWQKARELTREIYRLSSRPSFCQDFVLRDQSRRSTVSIMANIAEGFGRRSHREFINFLNMAHGSAAEIHSHLYVALDQGYLTESEFRDLYTQAETASKMIQSFMNYLNSLAPKPLNSLTP